MSSKNERVAWVRADSGLTLAKFGERIEISPQAVNMIEKGKSNPSDGTLLNISTQFKVSLDWLRDGVGEPRPPKPRSVELAELVHTLYVDSPESFRSRLITTLLRFDPNGPEWDILERIYRSLL